MKRLVLLLAIAVAASAQPLPLSTPEKEGISSERLKRVHAALEQLTREGKRSGAISMVVRNGRIVDWRTFGYRDVDAKLPMEKDTICALFSMTKVVTSVAALMLIEEGKLSLNDRLDKFAPEFADVRVFDGGTVEAPKLVTPKRPLTIRHLLTHTSGMIYGGGPAPVPTLYAKANVFGATTLKGVAAKVAALPLVSHPGEQWNYGVSTDMLGYVVQVASDMPFDRFVETRIAAPLKMRDTYFRVPADKRARTAKVHLLKADKLVAAPDPQRDIPSGGAGLYSTIGDYARFAQMLLNGGKLDGVQILGKKTVEMMLANHLNHLARTTTPGSESDGFGLGGSVRIDVAKGDRPGSVGEFGWAGAASTWFRIDPQEKLASLLFMQHAPMDGATAQKFATLVYQAIVE